MEGFVYIEQDLNGYPCDIWLQRYFQSFPFVGIKWFDNAHPLIESKNQLDKLYARDEDCDWICGGNIAVTVPKDVSSKFRPNCKVKYEKDSSNRTNMLYETKPLYTFQVFVVNSSNPSCRLAITIGCESESDRDQWIREFCEMEMQQVYLQACQSAPSNPAQPAEVTMS
jgi:hypothetical protein